MIIRRALFDTVTKRIHFSPGFLCINTRKLDIQSNNLITSYLFLSWSFFLSLSLLFLSFLRSIKYPADTKITLNNVTSPWMQTFKHSKRIYSKNVLNPYNAVTIPIVQISLSRIMSRFQQSTERINNKSGYYI